MKKLLPFLLFLLISLIGHAQTLKEDMKYAGKTIKKDSKKAGKAISKTAKKVSKSIKSDTSKDKNRAKRKKDTKKED